MEENKSISVKDFNTEETVNNLIKAKANETNDVKTALDLMFTHDALKDKETFEFAREEKREELRNDAEARKIQAETEKISKEVEKVKQEKQKQLAELDKVISAKQKEVEELKVEGDKATTFFNANKDILKYIGIREQKSTKTMHALMFPATVVFVFVQILLFPLTFIGLLLETVVGIVGGICSAIANNALKIVLSILIVALLFGGGFSAYYLCCKLIL